MLPRGDSRNWVRVAAGGRSGNVLGRPSDLSIALSGAEAVLRHGVREADIVRSVPAIIMLAGFTAMAEPPRFTPIANVYARHTISLDGKWRTIVDPYENGYYDFRLAPGGAAISATPNRRTRATWLNTTSTRRPNLTSRRLEHAARQLVLLRRHALVSHALRLSRRSRTRAYSFISAQPTTRASSG